MEPEPDISPRQIGGFRVLRRIASGATTDVLLARAEGPHGFERVVALKVLLSQFRSDPSFERMFAREASAYARLSHPAIVKLYDFFSADGQLVMVLEYVDGLPLHRLRAMLSIGGERLEDSAALFIGSRIFAALAAAHSARDPEDGEFSPVIHRDINPSNILVPWDGHVKISDFGIAKIGSATGDTRLGFIKGTYGYMAPEQVRGESVTVRADVYAATLVLWELLARRKAIQRGALPEVEVLKAMAKPEFPSLDTLRPEVHAEIREAVRRGLEPDPERRAITAEEMASVLRRMVNGDEGRGALANAIARVRPAPMSDGLAVTQARPTSSAEHLKPDSSSDPDLQPSRDPDATQPLNLADLPEDSGAFKRLDINLRAPELEDLVSSDGSGDDVRTSADLTLIEARRPPTDPPPATQPERGGPSTLPLPASLPQPEERSLSVGVVRGDTEKGHPETLRFGPASSRGGATRSPTAPRTTLETPSSRPVPRPNSTAPASARISSVPKKGVTQAQGPPVGAPKSGASAPSVSPKPEPSTLGSGSGVPASVQERTLLFPSPMLSPAGSSGLPPQPMIEVSPTLVSPSAPPRVGAPVSSVSPPAQTLGPPSGTTEILPVSPERTAPPPSVTPPPAAAVANPPLLPLAPLSFPETSAPSASDSDNQRVMPTMQLARVGAQSVPPRRGLGVLVMLGVTLVSALVGISAVELYLRSKDRPFVATSAPAKAPLPRASAATTTPTPSVAAGVAPAAVVRPRESASSVAPAGDASVAPGSSAKSVTNSPAASSSSSAPSATTAAPSRAASASPAGTDRDAAAAWTGNIFTEPSYTGHRVFVEGRVVGESPGPFQVRCGMRNVQVGSNGEARDVNVPCGGSILVTP